MRFGRETEGLEEEQSTEDEELSADDELSEFTFEFTSEELRGRRSVLDGAFYFALSWMIIILIISATTIAILLPGF